MNTRSTTTASPAVEEARATPMIAQFLEIKSAHADCILFYRMGDFYELFFDDAVVASAALGIVLTKRGKYLDEDIPMCGVPVERSEDYLRRLIATGRKVAVCEQTEDPAEAKKRGPKSVVRREVVRIVTPGTITEETLLEPGRPNLFLSVTRVREGDAQVYGLASVDISTGRFTLGNASPGELAAEIARIDPREIVVPDAVLDDPELKALWSDQRVPVSPLPREGMDAGSAERRLREHFGVATLDSFGSFSRAEVAAAGAALVYVGRTQIRDRPRLSPPVREDTSTCLAIDAATRASLELTRTQSGAREGSLLAAIDTTVTSAGARLLAERLAGPSTDGDVIFRRQDAVGLFLGNGGLRDGVRTALKSMPDLARALSRLALGRGGPRDLAAIRDGVVKADAVRTRLVKAADVPHEIRDACDALGRLDAHLVARIAALLADELPLNRRDGGFIRAGADAGLDEARALASDSRQVIAALQARYVEETGCRTLRIKHNNMIGFYVEVPPAFGEEALRGPHARTFIHRQTMSGAMRFSTTELSGLEAKIASASERALGIEQALFDEMLEGVVSGADRIAAAADAVGVIDVAAAMAELAAVAGWCRPEICPENSFSIVAARHPVVEAALRREGKPFIANDCDLTGGDAGRVALITGPNMGGKSTYLRQNALVVVLAQMGAYVPAASARIGIVDKLFSRVGAADDLARGRSTFMVEMVETAAILNQATRRSLVILDEIGRGTSTFDGLSIAWACVEHLHDRNLCRTLFATHFHELTKLSDKLPRLVNATLKVAEHKGDVVFLHEVVTGAADRSYGVQVAKLAGLPSEVVRRAREVLSELEEGQAIDDVPTRWRSKNGRRIARPVEELPLFAPPQGPAPDGPLRSRLRGMDVDGMSPRAALEALYALRREAVGDEPVGAQVLSASA